MKYRIYQANHVWWIDKVGFSPLYLSIDGKWLPLPLWREFEEKRALGLYFNSRRWAISVLKKIDPKAEI